MSDQKSSGFQLVVLSVALMAIWLLWSGIYEPLLISFGVFSVLLTAWVANTLGAVSNEGQPVSVGLRPLWYIPWLLKEIVLANIDVIKRILHPSLTDPQAKVISPTWIKVSAKQKTRLGRTLFANSITLTPGTVSVDVGEDYIWVHALSLEGAESLIDGGEMGQTVCKLEGSHE